MKVINMAHGELIMIGAYTTYTIQQLMPNLIEYSIIIAIPAAFIVKWNCWNFNRKIGYSSFIWKTT